MLDFLGLQQIIAKKWEFMEFGDFVKSPGTTTLSEMSFLPAFHRHCLYENRKKAKFKLKMNK